MALVVTSAPWQQVNMPALDLRRFLSYGLAEGVGSSTAMAVSQRAAGANMSVDIAVGDAIVQGDSVTNQGKYFAYNDAVFNLTGFTAAHATLPRIDRVTLRVRDAFHGDAANDFSFQIVTGTATSGATLANLTGAAAIPNSQLLLANILIPAASASIVDANIDTAIRAVSTFGGGSAVPTGSLTPFAGSTAPSGWFLCDGTAISRTTYATLFGIIATTYGVGDGSTTFNLPDMRGRLPVGKGTHADVDTLGENEGVGTVGNRTPKHGHTHTLTLPNHIHTLLNDGGGVSGPGGTAGGQVNSQNTSNPTTLPAINGAVGPDTLNTAPYLTLNYIIKS